MGGLPIPKFKRCCFCTRKLKVACVLIAFWSMLAITHSMRILFCPTCPNLYTEEGSYLYEELFYTKWVLCAVNIITLYSSFFYLLSIFLHKYRFSADIFMGFGFLTASGMCTHGVFSVMKMVDGGDCNNLSDTFAHFTYFLLWIYFILIVNSYRDDM